MDWPALAAAIGGPVVGIAAIRQARVEGRDSRIHSLAVAEGERESQRDETRSSRLFEMRRDMYVGVVQHALMAVDAIQATEPIVRYVGEDEAAGIAVPTQEEWNLLIARVLAGGSPEVRQATEDFWAKSRSFFVAAGVYRQVRNAAGPGQQTADAMQAMNDDRQEALAAFDRLKELVRDELETL